MTSHSVTLSNLQPNTTYHYRVKSKDAAGNLATSNDFTFTTGFTTTLFADDFNAATIDTNKWNKGTNAGNQSLVASSRLELRSQGSETGWVITRHAYAAKNTIVSVKVVQPNNDGDLGISPTFNLASRYGLYDQPNWYRFYVYRNSSSGPYRLFVQWKKSSVEDGLDVTGSLVINGAVYLRLRFDETNIHFEASLDGVNWTDTYTEAFGLPGHTLDSNFYYELAAYNTSSKGVLAVDDFAINTSASTPDTQPPQISGVTAQNITTTGAQIFWQTDEASDSQVEYGLTAGYGSSSPLDAALVTSHTVTLSGLQPNTTYHYRVKSKDAAGNLAVSGNFTFATAPATVVNLNSPNGGEWWFAGTNQQITWSGSSSITNVKLEFSHNAGATWRTIATSAPNNGSYNWQAPDTVSNTCLIRVSDAANANVADVSDGTFFIAPSALVNFTPSPSNPVLDPGPPGSWDENIRERGWVMYENGVYYMWYGGWQGAYDLSVPQLLKLGYASSTDGINWTKHAGNPVHSQDWTEDVVVVKDGNTYYLYAENEYTGDGDGALIDLYTSTDRINWTRYGTVLRPSGSGWEAGDVGTPTVWKEGDTWYMLYEGLGAGFAGQVGLATSSDGKNWTRYANNPVLSHANASRDIAIDSIIKINGVYYAYGHYDSGGHDWVGGLFTSTNLTAWSAYPGNPIVYNSPVIVDAGVQYRLYGLTSSSVAPYHVALSPITNDLTPPLISNVAANGITTSAATISWTTDEASDSQVEYGLTTSYGASTSLNSALVTSHAATLSGLQPNTTYHYRVKSKDAAGNLAVSGNFTFTTAPPAPAFEVTLEAENMPVKTGGGSRPPGWALWNNGHLAQTVNFPSSDSYRFTLRAYGSFAAGEWSKAELRINQVARATISVNTSAYTEFTATFSVNAGSQEVAVAFINDLYSPPDDRNLYVDWLRIQSAGAAVAAAVSDDADGKAAPSSAAKEFIPRDETIPSQLALQAYPNPLRVSAFNTATIVLALPQRAEIELHVFDAAGRRAHEWPAGAYAAGHHELIWNGRNREGQGLSTGVYFLRLRHRPENTAAWSHIVRRVLIVK